MHEHTVAVVPECFEKQEALSGPFHGGCRETSAFAESFLTTVSFEGLLTGNGFDFFFLENF